MSTRDLATALRWRLAGHSRPLPAAFTEPLRDRAALEIGGPSGVFGAAGLVPAYPIVRSMDNVQFAASTAWHELSETEAFAPEGAPLGVQHVLDGAALEGLADDSYDAVCSSHVIEHFANPLGALAQWRRVVRPGGHLLMVAPHHEGTFDRRRPVTPLDHMIEDFDAGTGEDDLTHLQETLALHDHTRDVAQDRATWEADRRANDRTRLLHHHVFNTRLLLGLLDRAGVELLAAETRFPHDIYVLARFASARTRPDNAAFLARRRPSPFRGDR